MNLILLTIAANYALVAVLSVSFVAELVGQGTTQLGTRSIFNFNAFALLISSCLLVLFLEYLPVWLRHYLTVRNGSSSSRRGTEEDSIQ